MYLWRGIEFEDGEGMSINEFVERVKERYWGDGNRGGDIEIVEEMCGEESDEFMNLFD
jgi:hypothetical protein